MIQNNQATTQAAKVTRREAGLAMLDRALQQLMWQERLWLKAYLREVDLDLPPFMVLSHLSQMGGTTTIAALVERLEVPSTTMTGHIDRLEEKGLITRKFGTVQDRRMVSVRITAKGNALVERVRRARHEHVARTCAKMPETDIQQLVSLLDCYLNPNDISG